MASNDGNVAAHLGDVIDYDGNAVRLFAAPDGTVVVEHVMGSFELEPRARDELRELLDRAAMPRQVPPLPRAEKCPRCGATDPRRVPNQAPCPHIWHRYKPDLFQRPCCDHCNNGEGDLSGHVYTLDGPHDGPCEQCADEEFVRRENDQD